MAAPGKGLLQRTIPASGQAIPAIGVGTSGSYEVPIGSPEFDALKDVLKVFFESGGSVIDTSPNYSNAEDVLGDLRAELNLRDRIFLATKLAALQPKDETQAPAEDASATLPPQAAPQAAAATA